MVAHETAAIYQPTRDPNPKMAITILQQDVQRLINEDELNDTLIDFRIKQLLDTMPTKNAKECYIFSACAPRRSTWTTHAPSPAPHHASAPISARTPLAPQALPHEDCRARRRPRPSRHAQGVRVLAPVD